MKWKIKKKSKIYIFSAEQSYLGGKCCKTQNYWDIVAFNANNKSHIPDNELLTQIFLTCLIFWSDNLPIKEKWNIIQHL